jgi:ribonuclease P protein component
LRASRDIAEVIKEGRKAGRPHLVVHLLDAEQGNSRPALRSSAPGANDNAAKTAFVVGRRVGSSVVRHRVVRQLRHLVLDRSVRIPDGSRLVVRAAPAAATAGSAVLGRDLDAALDRLLPRRGTDA